ncbi:UGSC family (seleno)protein [Streptodolium elevatio]|uniref:UGSC-like domain-containing protein n=1 Tax=Streptodolium elevatio TaxID=3157996 RepID=A0ABV3D8M9_9ACTN
MIEILSPEGRVGTPAKELAPSPELLSGKRIAVLDNLKPHAGYIQGAIARLVAERTGATVTLEIAKVSAALPAEPEVVERLRAEADLVITGSADCGSCTSWSAHDTVELEQLGLPTVLLATAGFTELAEQVTALYGLPQARVLTVPGPLGGSSDAQLDAMAADAVERTLELFTAKPEVRA